METLERWIEREYHHAAAAMQASISPLDLVKRRPGFGQTIVARRGAIVASPVLGAYDPDPDYFFHWYRDSAIVIDALRLLFEQGAASGSALEQLADFVRFSLSLQALDGRSLVASPAWRSEVAPDFVRYLRTDAELTDVHGEAVAAEVRVNPDGTLDISRWARPQHDGAALRALALLRWLLSAAADADCGAVADADRGAAIGADLGAAIGALVRADLAYTRRHWLEPCFDIWEEEKGLHYYTLRVCAAALTRGAVWLEAQGDREQARACRADAQRILQSLDRYWLTDKGYYSSRMLESGARSTKELDIAVILATLQAPDGEPTHCVHDPRMHATLARLEALFDGEYPINRVRERTMAPAMGRYAGDHYYSGGAYYFSTLGAAEFCFRAATGAAEAQSWIEHGNAFLQTVRAHTPVSGDLSEQFDRSSGIQTSAKHLAWSYAAFISCIAARRAVGS